jgi:chemotaxis protein histidine kinase CheA
MPNYSFMPVIGSSFDADAAQMQWGAGYNKSVEEGNRAAAEQAQQTQNRWLAQIANIRSQAAQQEAATQTQEQQSALSQAADARAAAESARRFNVQADVSKQDIASKDKQFTFNQDYANQQERKQLDEISNAGEFLVPKAKAAKTDVDKALAKYEAATKEFNERTQKAGMLMSPGTFRLNPKTQEFEAMPGAKTPPTQEELNFANEAYTNAKSDLQTAKISHDAALAAMKSLQQEATRYSLQIGDDGTVYSPRHGKAFGIKPLATPDQTAPTPAAGPLRVGKYAVTPADAPPVAPRPFAGPPMPPTPVPAAPTTPSPVPTPVAPPPQAQAPPPTSATPPAAPFAFGPPMPPAAPPAPPPLPTPAAGAEMQAAPAEFHRVDYAAPATYQNWHQVLDSYDKGRISKTQANAILGAKFNWARAQASGPEWKTATHWAPNPSGLFGGYTKDSPWE